MHSLGEKVLKQERQYGCMDYRQEMVLLGLKRKLQNEKLSDAERKEVLVQIQKLESAMDMD